MNGSYYKEWPLLDNLPDGWSFLTAAGSPLSGYEFAISGSPLRGGKTALVRVNLQNTNSTLTSQVKLTANDKNHSECSSSQAKSFRYNHEHAKTVNDLARQKFKQKLLADILVDLTICEIEGWSKRDYIDELRELINGIGGGVQK